MCRRAYPWDCRVVIVTSNRQSTRPPLATLENCPHICSAVSTVKLSRSGDSAEVFPARLQCAGENSGAFYVHRRRFLMIQNVKAENAGRGQVEVAADDDLRAFVRSGGKPGAARA